MHMDAIDFPFDAPAFLSSIMDSRQHVAPKRLIEPGPNPEQLEMIVSAASHAPDHGVLRPWRFILIPYEKRDQLGHAFVHALKDRDPEVSNDQIEQAYSKAFRSPCLMLCVLDTQDSSAYIPTIERIISLGCAIQIMLLMAQALEVGSAITSGQAVNSKQIRNLFSLSDDEEGVCFLNFGSIKSHTGKRNRPRISEFFTSI